MLALRVAAARCGVRKSLQTPRLSFPFTSTSSAPPTFSSPPLSVQPSASLSLPPSLAHTLSRGRLFCTKSPPPPQATSPSSSGSAPSPTDAEANPVNAWLHSNPEDDLSQDDSTDASALGTGDAWDLEYLGIASDKAEEEHELDEYIVDDPPGVDPLSLMMVNELSSNWPTELSVVTKAWRMGEDIWCLDGTSGKIFKYTFDTEQWSHEVLTVPAELEKVLTLPHTETTEVQAEKLNDNFFVVWRKDGVEHKGDMMLFDRGCSQVIHIDMSSLKLEDSLYSQVFSSRGNLMLRTGYRPERDFFDQMRNPTGDELSYHKTKNGGYSADSLYSKIFYYHFENKKWEPMDLSVNFPVSTVHTSLDEKSPVFLFGPLNPGYVLDPEVWDLYGAQALGRPESLSRGTSVCILKNEIIAIGGKHGILSGTGVSIPKYYLSPLYLDLGESSDGKWKQFTVSHASKKLLGEFSGACAVPIQEYEQVLLFGGETKEGLRKRLFRLDIITADDEEMLVDLDAPLESQQEEEEDGDGQTMAEAASANVDSSDPLEKEEEAEGEKAKESGSETLKTTEEEVSREPEAVKSDVGGKAPPTSSA